MGLTHDFIGFPPIRVNENNNTINWWPHSCTLASIKGYLQEKNKQATHKYNRCEKHNERRCFNSF